MVNPVTVNVALIIPPTGADVDTWGANDINPNMSAIDGMVAGMQTVSLAASPVTLTSPAGFTPTPSAGPTQSQNAILKLTGTLTNNVTVTLPIPGRLIVDNQCVGAFVVTLRAVGAGQVIGVANGDVVEVYNDGTNVRFISLGRVGKIEHWAGLSAMPAWVTACTVPPYLLCAGSTTYAFATFPALAAQLLGKFGGNGVTTFGVPDLAGRMPLAYDSSGSRITVAGCGINGQTLGASLDQQTVTLAANQIPSITSVNASQAITVTPSGFFILRAGNAGIFDFSNAGGSGLRAPGNTASMDSAAQFAGNNNISVTYTNASQQAVPNVPPTQVTGIWVCKT